MAEKKETKAAAKKEKAAKPYQKKRHCPKCGPGVNLAAHKNRQSCGKCGYYEKK